MIQTGFESRVKVQQIIENQLPSFILDENPNASEFLKQYYISQEHQGAPIDIAENLDQYLKLDNLTPEVVVGSTTLSSDISVSDTTITVSSTKGFPNKYGLLKIDDEIITYTGITANTFTGCIRGFSGITGYHQDLDQEELVFSTSTAAEHKTSQKVDNLSSLFLQEFYDKLKFTIANQLQKVDFTSDLNVGTFLKEAKTLYKAKGTDESFRILFGVLYNEKPSIINLERFLLKPSYSEYLRREVAIAEVISGSNPVKLVGQTIKKTTDENTSASLSSVEPFSRFVGFGTSKDLKTFYKLGLFVGYDELSSVSGNFTITPSTRTTRSSSTNSSIITVDSTIGFPESGQIVTATDTISYTSKSINQFFGCSGITVDIAKNALIRNNDTYYGYEDGDTSKKVEFRLLGVLSDFNGVEGSSIAEEGDTVFVKNLGDLIENPDQKTYKEIFANSWIYNTSTRYEASSINGSVITLKSDIDKSSLKIGDRVELLERGLEVLVTENNNPRVTNISGNVVTILGSFNYQSGKSYDLRRKINTASSSGTEIEYGNDSITSDVQNIYSDGNEYVYVASNSLPSSSLNEDYTYRYDVSKNTNVATILNLSDENLEGNYETIGFSDNAPFLTGDRVYYQPSSAPLVGLETGFYYVEVLSDPKKIKLYSSRSFIGGSDFFTFNIPGSGLGQDTFILSSQKSNQIGAQKIFKKFPLSKNITGPGKSTTPGTTGMLINGVEISNYKSTDKIYYGPLNSINVLSGGSNYDVINPPNIEVSSGTTTALVQPVIKGSIVDVYVDSQDFDIDKILSVNIAGGNGSGAVLEPVLRTRFREVSFDGRQTTDSGGISTTSNRIQFLSDHNFQNAEQVVYNNNGNSDVVIGSGSSTLINNASYFVGVVNNTTIELYKTLSDYNSGTNVTFSTGTYGTHKFRSATSKNVVSEVKIIDGGSGYTNRKLVVSPSNISTEDNKIVFENHGFETGELIKYDFETSSITGISTNNQYFVLKSDDDSFRICDAGIAGTITSNYNRRNYVKFSDSGSGYQYFSYPSISVSIKYNPVGFSTSTQVYQELNVTPVVKGSIDQLYVYEKGTGYGSTVLNYENNPVITVKNGKYASIIPNVVNGQIQSVGIQYGGIEYYSVPDLNVVDPTNAGSGAKLRAIISNGTITDVKVINAGIGYSSSSYINVNPSGSGSVLQPKIRSLTVNNNYVGRFGDEVLFETDSKLKYTVSGYFNTLRNSFGESDVTSANPTRSKIIGWAYDGNPIYGLFGYSDPENTSSTVKRLVSGYVANVSNVLDRPSNFNSGFFVEDYKFTNNGDLDEKNGRYGKTLEFPNGVYAYYATVDSFGNSSFPYFIGNEYQSNILDENENLDQSFDFSSSNLLRNTLPYKVSDKNAGYDHFGGIDDVSTQKIKVDSVLSGSITEFNIINSGSGYSVDDSLVFDNAETNGEGLNVIVKSIKGKDITDLTTTSITYTNSLFTWKDKNSVNVTISPNHQLNNGDYVFVSGFSESLTSLNGIHQISVIPETAIIISDIDSSASIGTTEIYVSYIPENISIGSSLGIGTETFRVLNKYPLKNILRVERGLTGVSHTQNSTLTYNSDSFRIFKSVDYFNSKANDKVYFNPVESIGFGTVTGISSSTSFEFGGLTITRSIPSKSIYIENHPFKNNQQISYTSNGSNINVSTDGVNTISLPSTVFAVNKGKNVIGIKTTIDSDEVFFHSGGSDNDLYLLESSYSQITGEVSRIKSTISLSESHGLSVNDSVKLTVNPSLTVGIGTSTSVRVVIDSYTSKILINPIGFSSSSVSTNNNSLSLPNHQLNTGDKVIYSADVVASGLSTDGLYVYKVDDNTIKLCETKIDSLTVPPTTVSIASTGGESQLISLINPRIRTIKNNDLKFDLSDSSLTGYNFKLYYDENFENEFISTGSTSEFNTSLVGNTLTISYDSNIPERLYYNLEKSGFIGTTDKEVSNSSEILFVNSEYNNDYNVVSIGSSSFDIVLQRNPEKLNYTQSECDTLKYTTTSKSATGPLDTLKVLSSGSGYKKLPTLSTITSTSGKDANIVAKSNTIGKIKQIKTINDEFEYPSDPTLQPTAKISSKITVKDSNTIDYVTVNFGGSGYISTPDLIIVDSNTRQKIDSGILEATLSGSSIQFVDVVSKPQGLPEDSVEVFATNNSNGITIQRMESGNSGIFTCLISQPTSGLAFTTGQKVYVEGIQKYSSDGSGFNSEDYGYQFFTINDYVVSSPYDRVEFDLSGITTNTGIAKTVQDYTGIVISKDNYPRFTVVQKKSEFAVNELLYVNGLETDLTIQSFDGYFLKVNGTYELNIGDIIFGNQSGSKATIESIELNSGFYKINYSVSKDFGWNDNVGELSSDSQVTANNDYYQNLSYSVKSSKEYSVLESPVFSILHTSGMKNFADTKIQNVEKYTGIGTDDYDDNSVYFYNIIEEDRVDSIYNFDFVKDADVLGSSSKLITLQNKKIADSFIFKEVANKVLSIDDFSNQFSYFEDNPSEFLNILKFDNLNSYENYLVRVTNANNTEIQLTEIVLLNDEDNQFIVQKGSVHNSDEEYGSFELYTDEYDDTYFRFIPVDPYNTDYDLKLIKNIFTSSSAGIGITSIGFVDLISSNGITTSGVSTSIVNLDSSEFESLFANIQVIDDTTNDMNFVEIYVTHDGSNTFLSEYYSDSDGGSLNYSGNFIGSFSSNVSGGVLSLNYTNTGSNVNTFRAKVVGFGTTSTGIGTYRFKTNVQTDGSERSVIYQSDYSIGVGQTTVISLDKILFNSVKSLVEVSIGSTKSVHQVMMVQDVNSDIYVQQSAILSVSGISTFDTAQGIGTFAGNNSGSNLEMIFIPDSDYASNEIVISSFNQCFYTEIDNANVPETFVYGDLEESVDIKFYNSINGDRINRTNFNLTYNGTPIFAKKFNPQDSNILTPSTGTFNITNHFFRNGEELIYTPKSSVVGLATTAMSYDDGVTAGLLPSRVFAIVNSEDNFQISTSKGGAIATFTDLGGGNIHQFEMFNKNNKSIITVDDLIQHPLTLTGISHTLSNSIGTGVTVFELSGISLVNPSDILRIDEEYLKVVNVGLGTTSIGPISNNGSVNLVETIRGFVGTLDSTHTSSTQVDVYRGGFNIVENEIHFVDAPRGNSQIDKTSSNLDYETSEFSGRVFLRSDYSTNKIYDDISNQFNGIGRTFTLQVGGANTSGIGTIGSNGIVLINGIFQQPSTDNNPNGNFNIFEQTTPSPGITTLVFSGITKPDTDPAIYFTSDIDVNINETPRGGIIISYGSTQGLGFAPLVSAAATVSVSGTGAVQNLVVSNVGSGYRDGSFSAIIVDPTQDNGGDPASLTAIVGAGGTLSISIGAGGTGYNNPQVVISDPTYANLPVIGVSRLGVGNTTQTGIGLSISLKVGPVGATGIGSTYFGVTEFEFSKTGYSFQRGDVFKPVGLVTDSRLSSPLQDFEITVVDTYSDKFASWEFGKLDLIDSISSLQDGVRTTFPLNYNGELRSFEKLDDDSNLGNNLLIFINGILQEPGYSYIFNGGTSFLFTTPPKENDKVTIYFYKGLDSDVIDLDVNETLKVGDNVQVLSYENVVSQNTRTIYDITSSDTFETETYSGTGVNDNDWRPLKWIRQKTDKIIAGEIVSKQRDSIKSLSFPTANIISDIDVSTNIIFVDDVSLFKFEDPDESSFNALVVDNVTVGVGSTAQVDYVEFISNLTTIQGSSGNVTGIGFTNVPQLAIEFTIDDTTDLSVGYPIYITNTNVGNGVVSIVNNDSEVVAIGLTYLDNIYYVQSINSSTGIITCYVDSGSSLSGIQTSGNVGNFSWGRLSNTVDLERLNPISIGVTGRTVSGLTTYPVIMRRGGDSTLRKTGSAYRK